MLELKTEAADCRVAEELLRRSNGYERRDYLEGEKIIDIDKAAGIGDWYKLSVSMLIRYESVSWVAGIGILKNWIPSSLRVFSSSLVLTPRMLRGSVAP